MDFLVLGSYSILILTYSQLLSLLLYLLLPYNYAIIKHDSGFTVTGNYMVDDKITCCTCKFNNDNALPCRHIFSVRRFSNIELLTLNMIPDRWRKIAMLAPSTNNSQSYVEPIVSAPPITVLSQNEKYCKSLPIVKEFANILSQCGEKEFYQKLTFLENLLKSWRNGESVIIS